MISMSAVKLPCKKEEEAFLKKIHMIFLSPRDSQNDKMYPEHFF